jgi:dephospho-CoA kinase
MYEGRNVFGLTGGIGSGKSTVSAELSNLGAVVIDADKIVREIQEPGMPILPEMQKILGDDIIADDGSLIRSRAAERMFAANELFEKANDKRKADSGRWLKELAKHRLPTQKSLLEGG